MSGSEVIVSSGRPLPEVYRKEWAELVERQRALFEGTDSSALLFEVGKEALALPTSAIQEVSQMRQLHTIPHRRGGLLVGIANWRGELLTCVSLATLLGIGGSEQDSASPAGALLVVNWRGSRLGMPVGRVLGTCRFRRAELKPTPPAVRTAAAWGFGILEWQTRLVLFLDTERLMTTFTENLT